MTFVNTAVQPGVTGPRGGQNLSIWFSRPQERTLFPLASTASTAIDVSAVMWAGLAVLTIGLIALDLVVFARHHAPSLRESAVWSVVWIAVAVGFGAVWWWWQGAAAGSQYFSGYLLERSLSLDNVFVFAVIIGYFSVPDDVQPKLLTWGIALALLLRLVFILIGAALLDAFHVTFYVFGALLLYTAYKIARHHELDVDPEHNPALRLLRRRLPVAESYAGERMIVRRAGRRMATPLLAVFVVVATTDVIFAVDSIPAIFAVTRESFIVFAANAFAILGLRALYFLLAGMRARFAYLSYGLAVILGFVGVKMVLVDVWHVPIWLSLTVIAVVLLLTVLVSVRATSGAKAAA